MAEKQRSGIPVDAFGGATIDPTKNVLDLVEAANKRQDDLRLELSQRLHDEISTLKEFLKETMIERDRRYEHRYDSITRALDVGLAAQKELMQQSLTAQRSEMSAALAASDRAVSKAEISTEKRFEGVNEFRAQLGDQQRTLMPRSEAESRLSSLSEKVGVLEGFRTEVLSRGSGAKEGYGWAIGLVGLVLSMPHWVALVLLAVWPVFHLRVKMDDRTVIVKKKPA